MNIKIAPIYSGTRAILSMASALYKKPALMLRERNDQGMAVKWRWILKHSKQILILRRRTKNASIFKKTLIRLQY